ncbi:hypothetical protein FQR65_LT18556 [Abscondita terminalis]|nr:hypothetical protein FQR65_LT18556 [Abscondita terminalis]
MNNLTIMLINIFPENEPIEFVVGEEGTLQQITTEELYPLLYSPESTKAESHKEGVIIPSDTLLDISITRTEESSIPSTEIESHDLAVAVDKSTSIQITEKNILVDPPATATESEAEMNQTVHSDKVIGVDKSSSIEGQTSELNIPVNLFLPAPEQVVNQDTPIKKNMTLEESLQNNKEKDILADIPSPFKNNLFWPDTPKVAKKLKEKIPSVATSKEWQEYFRKKKNKKLEKEHEIEERKRKRLVNKKNKIKQETVLKKKKGVPKLNPKKPEDENLLIETWFCSICKEDREEDMIKCQKCLQWMHEKLVETITKCLLGEH